MGWVGVRMRAGGMLLTGFSIQNMRISHRIQVVCTGGDPLKLHRIAIYSYITIPSIYSGMLQHFLYEDISYIAQLLAERIECYLSLCNPITCVLSSNKEHRIRGRTWAPIQMKAN